MAASPNQRYYELWFDESDPSAMIAYECDLQGVDRLFVHRPGRRDDWPEGVRFVVDGEHAEDYLCAANGWILVSDRARHALESCGIREVQFFPVDVQRRDTGKAVGTYWLLYAPVTTEALDWEHTKWIDPNRRDESEAILNIAIVALSRSCIGSLDVFKLSVRGHVDPSVYVSDRFRRCLQRTGATTGFSFKPIKVYG